MRKTKSKNSFLYTGTCDPHWRMTKRQTASPAPPPPSDSSFPAFELVPRRFRHDGWTPERQRAFIAALAEWGNVTHAAESAGMTSVAAYQLRRQPGAESFRKAWDAALTMEGPAPTVPLLTMRGLMHTLEAQRRRELDEAD